MGKRKGAWQGGKRNVGEESRIKILRTLEEFCAGNDIVYTFDADLDKEERAEVHFVSRRMGLVSKSSGHGDRRCVSVHKQSNGKAQMKKKENIEIEHLTFSDETKLILQNLFTQYPPFEEVSQKINMHANECAMGVDRKNDSTFSKPSMLKVEIAKRVELLASRLRESRHLQEISEQRSKLPIASFKDAITSAVEKHQVVLIAGETGCGKTTQVPQFLLDHMWGKGETCKIVCSQPRRISAISVAERIASERGENVGESVGYKIRLESSGGKHSSIMFCTNGVLLRLLVGRGALEASKTGGECKAKKAGGLELTHIIVDEIHERDRYADFMLTIIRDMLPLCPHLRLIMMSATFDAERFSQYFGGCPIIQVPGFTYPVKSYYLEDVLCILRSAANNHLEGAIFNGNKELTNLNDEHRVALDEALGLAWSSDDFDPLLELISTQPTPETYNYQHSESGMTPLMICAGKGRVDDICLLLSFGVACYLKAKDGSTALDWAQRENQTESVEIIKAHMNMEISESLDEKQLLERYQSTISSDHVDTVLIEKLLIKICSDSNKGAILVFLPGWEDINETRERLLSSPIFSDPSKCLILALHSLIPSEDQKQVFKRPRHGIRKIILSTNIAETSVTIDDIVYVIDCGRMKEKSYDPYNNVSTFQSSWVSKASAKQRRGRAGRCQPGFCYHLYSKARAMSLLDYQVPEIKRMPIDELCLQLKMLNPESRIVEFLQKTPDPPVFEAVRNAIIVLQDLGALSKDESLTELGEKIGSLPVRPSTSKMLLFAILVNCLDPALTFACASEYRDPFVLPVAPDAKKKANAAKAKLSSLYGGKSDQLTVIAAFESWMQAKAKGKKSESEFCSYYFISPGIMYMILNMRKKLRSELVQLGFIPQDVSSYSLNSKDPGILRAVLAAGMYPMVGRLLPPLGGAQRAVVETSSGAKVRLHYHSCNYRAANNLTTERPLLVYDEITRGDMGMYVKNCTIVGPYPLLFWATELAVAPLNNEAESDLEDDSSDSEEDEMDIEGSVGRRHGERLLSSPDNPVLVVVDRWIKFQSTALDVAQIYCLREQLSAAILFKVKESHKALPPALAASMHAIAGILSNSNISEMPSAKESIDTLTTMVSTARIDPRNSSNGMHLAGARHSCNTRSRALPKHNRSRNRRGIPNVQMPMEPLGTDSMNPYLSHKHQPAMLSASDQGLLLDGGPPFKRRGSLKRNWRKKP
ncbi:DExH-box ATP-dependent RNA helicase DExH6 isoform X1 [Amborella trichopoda]|uniref:DExH-box ATP-dependent RNA helicase DExH6 isoform X1 n=1 Tax=Amborella trichopoda TaxID=13333 RepID=UPI0009BFD2E2|nr:DExH-box ATP-dependent RNA helicase DExH6 isoform X1 [Amborella trichopoda]|eukprot:XP_020528409.1 DExH-box ATP-dependent RNA helicase DExH6 isoform X1 [Amborella trichopoda]